MRSASFFLFFFLIAPAFSWAQLDPSSSLLLNGGGNETLDESGLDSGRYEVRPSGRAAPVTPVRPAETSTTNARGSTTPALKQPSPQPTPAPVKESEPAEAVVKPSGSSEKSTPSADPRVVNLFEIEVSSFYFYHSSRADYWYRRSESHGPGVRLGMTMHLSPQLAFQSSIASTLTSSVANDPAEKGSATEVNYQWLNAGLSLALGGETRATDPSMKLSLNYAELDIRVPAGEDHRARLLTSGALIGLVGVFPSAKGGSAWLWGFSLMPYAEMKEKATDLNLRSGGRPRTSVYELYLGREVSWGQKNTMFWKLSHRLQQTRYKGTSRLPDPITGARPEGLSVTESMLMLETGLTFGP